MKAIDRPAPVVSARTHNLRSDFWEIIRALGDLRRVRPHRQTGSTAHHRFRDALSTSKAVLAQTGLAPPISSIFICL